MRTATTGPGEAFPSDAYPASVRSARRDTWVKDALDWIATRPNQALRIPREGRNARYMQGALADEARRRGIKVTTTRRNCEGAYVWLRLRVDDDPPPVQPDPEADLAAWAWDVVAYLRQHPAHELRFDLAASGIDGPLLTLARSLDVPLVVDAVATDRALVRLPAGVDVIAPTGGNDPTDRDEACDLSAQLAAERRRRAALEDEVRHLRAQLGSAPRGGAR